MKFIHKISKITSYIIQICLLIFVLSSNSLWGEVHRVGEKVGSAVEFKAFLQENTGPHPKGIENFKNTLATDMPGYGVFIPEDKSLLETDSGPGHIYVAKKHYGKSYLIHNPKSGGHPFNTTFEDHTERQLALYLAAAALKVNITYQRRVDGKIEGKTAPEIHEEAKALRDLLKLTSKGEVLTPANVKGEFHIYTRSAPCTADISENRNFSCIKYYELLQKMFPNCKFHIYFKKPHIYPEIDIGHAELIRTKIIEMVENNNAEIQKYFKITSDKKELQHTNGTKWKSLKEVGDSSSNKEDFINIVNDMLEEEKERNALPIKQIEDIFNGVFATKSLEYHLVR